MYTIPNNVRMDSYKRGNENRLHAKNERHVLPSGENFVLSPVLNLQYTESSTKSLSQIRRISRSFYAVFIPNYVNYAISYSNIIYLQQTSFSRKHYRTPIITHIMDHDEHFEKQRMAQVMKEGAQNDERLQKEFFIGSTVILDNLCTWYRVTHGQRTKPRVFYSTEFQR